MNESLSLEEIKAFAVDWYRKLDEHAALSELLPMLASNDLEFQFPEKALHGTSDFQMWYEGGNGLLGVINIFFDEVHTVSSVGIIKPGDPAVVSVSVNWQARRWRPPAARSEWIGFDAFQTWRIARSPETRRPVLARYVVDEMRPMPGSVPL